MDVSDHRILSWWTMTGVPSECSGRGPDATGRCWMIVTSPENFELSAQRQFTLLGIKSRHRRKAERMRVGDLLVYYLIRQSVFAGACRIASTMFEEHERIWYAPGKPDEDYPWRVNTEPLVMPPPEGRPTADQLTERLTFVKKWPVEHWRLAFQGMVHDIPPADGRLILTALCDAVPGPSGDLRAKDAGRCPAT